MAAKLLHGPDATSRVAELVKEYMERRREQRTAVVVTGGTSLKAWVQLILRDPVLFERSRFYLSDFFLESEAFAEGRNDTNEASLLDGGFREAINSGCIKPEQFELPNYRDFSTLLGTAQEYGQRLEAYRGAAVVDLVFLSAGGGTYRDGGPEDPGHCAGIPHGRLSILSETEPYAVVTGMPKPPQQRATATPALLTTAERMFMFCLGPKKVNALENLRRQATLLECPACLVHETSGEGYVVTDIAD